MKPATGWMPCDVLFADGGFAVVPGAIEVAAGGITLVLPLPATGVGEGLGEGLGDSKGIRLVE